ncbi:hypothetical protein MANES_09G076586v8 [Manihot esculenta]|uniref:Uncharacterized protein n=1 Tax=Manihot esculenta TaxID=3983 RepID=A0ACB7H6T7_MANES|nr:hypothetical protein MANES_09G076586v8 [Manihot esculenta]
MCLLSPFLFLLLPSPLFFSSPGSSSSFSFFFRIPISSSKFFISSPLSSSPNLLLLLPLQTFFRIYRLYIAKFIHDSIMEKLIVMGVIDL